MFFLLKKKDILVLKKYFRKIVYLLVFWNKSNFYFDGFFSVLFYLVKFILFFKSKDGGISLERIKFI